MSHERTPGRTTLDSDEQIAADHAASTQGTQVGPTAEGLRRLVDLVGPDPSVLELGSGPGPGWDADHLEALGARVRRTDGAQASCDPQAARGRRAELLDAVVDPFTDDRWPSYDAVVALCLLLHVERDLTAGLLSRAADALRPDGVFLASLREGEGEGETWEHGASGNAYHVTSWPRPDLDDALRTAGLEPRWHARSVHGDERWLTVLAVRA
ncbi:class I SAM-dependent methyltransferase [Nocardioides litoris]|uniref:class I SAM-dependent methyltransferase n=1 Tax=Nocardioides litoris TaxID=1926648 RepID=UPI00112478CA|nr:methyltransferase domain-containing protein [Nocardioides litoris]